ncbi:hypothetical protein HK101_008581 [Irineochytrium annulatum]|nr:hypothetical protein HK101_008581 [Irineochytrium annulatum]
MSQHVAQHQHQHDAGLFKPKQAIADDSVDGDSTLPRKSLYDEGYGSMPIATNADLSAGYRADVDASFARVQLATTKLSEHQAGKVGGQGALRHPLRNLRSDESFERLSSDSMTDIMSPRSGVTSRVLSSESFDAKPSQLSQADREADIDDADEDGQVRVIDHAMRQLSYSDAGTRSNSLGAIGANSGRLTKWKPVSLAEMDGDTSRMELSRTDSEFSNRETGTIEEEEEEDDGSVVGRGLAYRNGSASSVEAERRIAQRSRGKASTDHDTLQSPRIGSTSSGQSSATEPYQYEDQPRLERIAEEAGLPDYDPETRSGTWWFSHNKAPNSPPPVHISRDRRPQTAPGPTGTKKLDSATSSSASSAAQPSRPASRSSGHFFTSLQSLREENEFEPTVAPASSTNPAPASLAAATRSTKSTPPSTAASTTSTKPASRWSKLPSLLPASLKKLGAKHSKSSDTTTDVDSISSKNRAAVGTPPPPSASNAPPPPPPALTTSQKRSVSVGRLLRRSPPAPGAASPQNHLLRRLIAHKKDASAAAAVGKHPAPTSNPLKVKGNQVGAKDVAAPTKEAAPAAIVGGSSVTLSSSMGSTGSLFDDEEEVARRATSGESEIDRWAGAKRRFDLRYKVQKTLGSGGHSTVRLAHKGSEKVVLKFIRNSSVWHWQQVENDNRKVPLEIHLMRQFKCDQHPNIISYVEHFEVRDRYIIVMEYLGEDWVDLYDYIEMFGPVKEKDSIEIFKQVVETILYLYKKGFHHNDIKDENILINIKTRRIKLIDFGSATAVAPGKTCELFYGTKKFAAPEAVRTEPYHPEAQEVWALGTLLFVLLFKMDPFTNDEEILATDIGRRISRYQASATPSATSSFSANNGGGSSSSVGSVGAGSGRRGLEISDEAVKSLKMMMEKEWSKRVHLENALELPVFKRVYA